MITVNTKTKTYTYESQKDFALGVIQFRKKILRIEFKEGFKLETAKYLFSGMENLTEIIFQPDLFSNVKKFDFCFEKCHRLNQEIKIDMASAESCIGMFKECVELNSKLIFYNSNKVRNITAMFMNCKKLNKEISIESDEIEFYSYILSGCQDFNQKVNIKISESAVVYKNGLFEDDLLDCKKMSLENKVYNYKIFLNEKLYNEHKRELYKKNIFKLI